MIDVLVNGAGLLLAAFVVGWFWLSGPADSTDNNSHQHHH